MCITHLNVQFGVLGDIQSYVATTTINFKTFYPKKDTPNPLAAIPTPGLFPSQL